MCGNSKGALARFGLLLGMIASATLLVAFVSNSWLTTKEPVLLPNSRISTTIQFRIGLWEVCPLVKRVNSTIHVPRPTCAAIKYEGWRDITHADLGLWTPLELGPVFVTRMRSCTVLTGSAVILLTLASLFALLGQCNDDNKTLIASGFFILGGLSLGFGLVIFATALSETLSEIRDYLVDSDSSTQYDYRYGWCFFGSGTAFILANLAALFSLSGYLNRFSSVDDMVREMVPGADRKLKELQRFSGEYLLKHTAIQPRPTYEIEGCRPKFEHETARPIFEGECGPLLNKTPPDVCTTNKCVEFDVADLNVGSFLPGVMEYNSGANSLAGQTVPITIKSHTLTAPVTYANLPLNKFGTLPHPAGTTLHQGFLGVSDLGSSSSNSSSGYCSKSKTLQHQRQGKKKCVKIETFQTPETGFCEFSKKANTLQYSGSAV